MESRTPSSKDPLLESGDSWDEVKITLNSVDHDHYRHRNCIYDQTEKNQRSVSTEDYKLNLSRTRPPPSTLPVEGELVNLNANSATLMSWSEDSEPSSSELLQTRNDLKSTTISSMTQKKRVRFKRKMKLTRSSAFGNNGDVGGSGLRSSKAGNSGGNGISLSNSSSKFRYPHFDAHTAINLATDARLCGGLSFLACLRITMQTLLMMLALFLVAFVLNLHRQVDSMQNELSDALAFYKSGPTNLHEMHSQLKHIQSNCSDQFDALQRFRQDLEQVHFSLKNTSSEISTVRQSVATAPAILRVPNEITELRKLVADLGSGISSDQERLSSLEKNEISIKSIVEQLSQSDLRLNKLETQLQNASFVEQWLTSSPLWKQLHENNEHLINQFVNIVNRQAELENKLNVTFLLLDQLVNQPKMHTTSTEDPYRSLK